MEKKLEIAPLLTNDTTSNTSTSFSPSPFPPNRFRGKSHSISHSPTESPAAATPATGFPSTFTARNLALPTTPTPLPLHPAQFSNASVRKGRRATIEHDIDLLTGEFLTSWHPGRSLTAYPQNQTKSTGQEQCLRRPTRETSKGLRPPQESLSELIRRLGLSPDSADLNCLHPKFDFLVSSCL